jgi:hypothetical protein
VRWYPWIFRAVIAASSDSCASLEAPVVVAVNSIENFMLRLVEIKQIEIH